MAKKEKVKPMTQEFVEDVRNEGVEAPSDVQSVSEERPVKAHNIDGVREKTHARPKHLFPIGALMGWDKIKQYGLNKAILQALLKDAPMSQDEAIARVERYCGKKEDGNGRR